MNIIDIWEFRFSLNKDLSVSEVEEHILNQAKQTFDKKGHREGPINIKIENLRTEKDKTVVSGVADKLGNYESLTYIIEDKRTYNGKTVIAKFNYMGEAIEFFRKEYGMLKINENNEAYLETYNEYDYDVNTIYYYIQKVDTFTTRVPLKERK